MLLRRVRRSLSIFVRTSRALAVVTLLMCPLDAVPSVPDGSGLTRRAGGFWSPLVPPPAEYRIDVEINPEKGMLRGVQHITLTNPSSAPVERLAIFWPHADSGKLKLAINGTNLAPSLGAKGPMGEPLVLFDLPEPVREESAIGLECRFEVNLSGLADATQAAIVDWYPRLWWGFPTCDNYDVRVELPPEYTLVTSGLLDTETKRYRVKGARSFGLFVGKGFLASEEQAGDVTVRCVYRPEAEKWAEVLLATAVDVIGFYRERFGFYPFKSLGIMPGSPEPVGGCPVAAAMVAIHGEEEFEAKPLSHWRWITAHEIGHQYWGEHLLEKDSPGWLWIGLGIYADREYTRARELDSDAHRAFMADYKRAVEQGLDTTIAVGPEHRSGPHFDVNNLVIHGKGYSVISTLACWLGQAAFDRIYQRCLQDFQNRRMGVNEFQAVCEEETGQDLGWFFDQWVRSNRYLACRITGQSCEGQGRTFLTRAEIKYEGDLQMPVPVVAMFKDGSRQTRFADRLLPIQELKFESTSPLAKVMIDPSQEMPILTQPPK